MSSIDEFAREKLKALDARQLTRTLVTIRPGVNSHARLEGREIISFCSNDYLGMASRPEVIAAARAATEIYGTGARASRYITGNLPQYEVLEGLLARLKGTGAATVFGSGYLANIGIIPCFCGDGDLILIDELCHASLLAGVRLSGAEAVRFRHNETGDLRRILQKRRGDYGRCLIVSEGVFGMDGDLAPVRDLHLLAGEWDAWLYLDDAHGFGVVGNNLGSASAFGDPVPLPLQMGTLSKAVGSYGGYICASLPVIEFIKNRARSAIYSTGLPAAALAASIAALEIIDQDRTLGTRVIAKARRFAEKLGLPRPQSAIVPLVIGEPGKALAASRCLLEKGFLVSAIRPPTVPEGTSRLRFTFSLLHSDGDINLLAEAVTGLGLMT